MFKLRTNSGVRIKDGFAVLKELKTSFFLYNLPKNVIKEFPVLTDTYYLYLVYPDFIKAQARIKTPNEHGFHVRTSFEMMSYELAPSETLLFTVQ